MTWAIVAPPGYTRDVAAWPPCAFELGDDGEQCERLQASAVKPRT